jgi:nucleotide-binding universal stress UspA family protein
MRVLIAVEDEQYGQAIIDFVTKHNWPADSEFKIVHVVEPLLVGSYMSIYPSPMLEEITEENVKYATKLVADMKEKLSKAYPNHHVFSDVFTEIPKYGILTAATEWKADMIVMGSHGRRGISHFLLGSVAEAVMSHADCSVTIVRLPADKKQESPEVEQSTDARKGKTKAGVK